MGFSPFGVVTEGMDVVKQLYSGYGEGAPQGRGPSQQQIAIQGNKYLDESFPKLDKIVKATISVGKPAADAPSDE
jgi:peptidyl-prolyl cis-trans isomerase A (cyclophilin A)